MENTELSQQHAQSTKQLTALLADTINLATFAVENGRLPESISFSDLFRMWEQKVEKGERLSEVDVDKLQYSYQILEAELAPVSAVSLRATDAAHSKKKKAYLDSDAGKHAKRMWFMAFAILGLIVGINMYQYMFYLYSGDWALKYTESFGNLTLVYWLAGSITPFAYGAFGATVRLLRITERRLRERSFDPRRLPEHLNRLVLGTLSGGVVVLMYSAGGVGETDVKLTEAALGFIAGYSIDLMFSLLDRMVKAISPGTDKADSNVRAENIESKEKKEKEAKMHLQAAQARSSASTQTQAQQSSAVDEKSFAKVEIEKAASVVNMSEVNPDLSPESIPKLTQEQTMGLNQEQTPKSVQVASDSKPNVVA